MQTKRFLTVFVFCAIFSSLMAQMGPTMGWSSWNTYGVNISDELIRSQADAMVETGLAALGYDHINIDDGFFGGRNTATGELIIHPTRFPNGLKPVADYIHSKGLKAGIYSDAGANTCGNFWAHDELAVNVGLYNYDQRDIDFYFKQCGFDFIKVDFCGGMAGNNSQNLILDPQERYTAIAEAIEATGRSDARMNVCRWNYPGNWVRDLAFSWRTTEDIYDGWKSIAGIIAENLYLSAYSSAGKYNDMDMLEVGRSLTVEEDKTHFGLWCIMNSPLLIGCDLTTIRPTTLNLLSNQELIALNQDTLYQQAYIAGYANGCHLLVKDVEKRGGLKRAFAVYNPSAKQQSFTLKFEDIDLEGRINLRDVFEQKDLGEYSKTFTITLPAHATRIYVAEGEVRTERVRYEAETGYISDYQELRNNQEAGTGIYVADANSSGGFKVGWLGGREENDLLWNDVYSEEGGDYQLTIAYYSGTDRQLTVSVNGDSVTTLTLNAGNWQTPGTEGITVSLKKGRNTVRLSNANTWMPDIDFIELRALSQPDGIHVVESTTTAVRKAFDLGGRPAVSTSAVYIMDGRKLIGR